MIDYPSLSADELLALADALLAELRERGVEVEAVLDPDGRSAIALARVREETDA